MSKDEDEYTLEQLSSSDTVADLIAMMHINMCLNPKHPLTEAIVQAKGAEWLHERLEYKYTHWVPQILEGLETGKQDCAIEEFVSVILCVRRNFPSTIEPLVNLAHLAKVRRDGHIRTGLRAVEFIRTEKGYTRGDGLRDLAFALLAEVPKELIGDPTETECTEAYDELFFTEACKDGSDAEIVQALENFAKLLRERSVELNTALNHLL